MPATVVRKRFSVEEYHAMASAGILAPDERVELIDGEIIEMSPIGSRHAACVRRLARFFHRAVGRRALVGVQDPIRLGDRSEPEPDLSLLTYREDFFADRHPGPEEVLLLVEVADTSLAYDRRVKLPLYARHDIVEVWLVDLEGRSVEVHRRPGGDGYAESRVHGPRVDGPGAILSPEGLPELELAVRRILP